MFILKGLSVRDSKAKEFIFFSSFDGFSLILTTKKRTQLDTVENVKTKTKSGLMIHILVLGKNPTMSVL